MRVLVRSVLSILTTLVLLIAVSANVAPYTCNGPSSYQRFFSKFNIPSNSQVVIGGYLPNITSGWYCNDYDTTNRDYAIHRGVHGVFLRYLSGNDGYVIGVSQETFDPNKYQLFLFRSSSANTAMLRICKWTTPFNFTVSLGASTAKECLYNSTIPALYTPDMVVGISWDADRVTVFADRIYTYTIPNTNWSLVRSTCVKARSCAMQFPSQFMYYNVNVTSNGTILPSICDSPDCQGFATNVFAVADGGYIPSGFSFNNWFLLTNTSTIVNGIVISNQPMRVGCLKPVPNFSGAAGVFYFNESLSDGCNGYTTNSTPEAFRFNINDTQSLVAADSVVFYTVSGARIGLVCSNSSDPLSASAFSIPFGAVNTVYYCFLNVSYGVNYTLEFLSVLPPSVREFVITKYGSVYINGYGYVHAGELNAVEINIPSSAQYSGVWTVAATTFTDVMVDVNGTNIVRMLYCDTPERRLMCSQLSFDLQDGFYAITPLSEYYVEQPQAFVQLPAFNNHGYVVLELNVTFGTYVNDGVENFSINFNGDDEACVSTSQFTLNISSRFEPRNSYYNLIFDSKCPFNPYSVNNYLSFGKFCVSNHTLADSCEVKVFVKRVNTYYITTLYFQYSAGDSITGVPKPLGGVTDVSFFTEGVCSQYTIYGHKGEGIISKSNTEYIAGLYYTSPSGQILAFKNITTGDIYSVLPCSFSQQAAFIDGAIVGVMSSINNTLNYNHTRELPGFYYHSNDSANCTEPALVYSNIGVCKSGAIGLVAARTVQPKIQPMSEGIVSIPTNLTMQIRTEYIQLFNKPVSIDCAMYVCNGNPRCNLLLSQYASACQTIESSLQMGARLESAEVSDMLTISEKALSLGTIEQFKGGDYNFSNVLGASAGQKSFIEDLLFDKVVTNGLGTVDEDYKKCTNGVSLSDLTCAQYYNGIMVLPGVADAEKVHMYSASLMGGMVLGGVTAAAALPFSYAVQARLNYVALQTDVLQRNQQMLAQSFNSAISNITMAFENVNDAIQQTSQGLSTVAQALTKVQDVVNTQGLALSHLTNQLQNNFQAISSSISDIYARLDQLTADAQVDRLITGRLAALNAFVSQTMTKYVEVQASRRLAQQKVNECVKSQSTRYGFCGDDGEHIFSIVQGAPQGLMFLHTVLVPSSYINVTAVSGLCVDDTKAFVLKEPGLVMFKYSGNTSYFLTPRKMFEPRTISVSDLVQVESCVVTYFNLSSSELPDVVPDYIDVNKTLEEILNSLPNRTEPEFPLDVFNATYLNLTGEIADLEKRADALHNTSEELRRLIDNINSTLVDLEWLNRVETYIKWPWWVWLIIVIVLIFVVSLLVFCCISTGCCGCCGCCGACFRGPRLQPYEPIEKVHVQ
ncbi:spike protein [Bat alphacoronavirus]|uniref:Spike protein n=1 Tax=bat alphacoronavirus BtCoV/020_16/M.dau/FIN/2016 TaxID=3070180 RepID=A0AAE6KQ37_9ALPC|nr:spike protein [Bat alphacoronavirus]QDE55565.1 spike protein [Bat alphacoronavirus]